MKLSITAAAFAAASLWSIATVGAPSAQATKPSSVGAVSWHGARYVGATVAIRGYVIAQRGDHVFISDEAGGRLSPHDLPVFGPDVRALVLHQKYLFAGRVERGPEAGNGLRFRLQETAPAAPMPH